MNVYSCWYQGNFGYSCPVRQGKWIFVPELGQFDNKIYKNLVLEDLNFKYAGEKSFEKMRENRIIRNAMLIALLALFFPRSRPLTVAGRLLISC